MVESLGVEARVRPVAGPRTLRLAPTLLAVIAALSANAATAADYTISTNTTTGRTLTGTDNLTVNSGILLTNASGSPAVSGSSANSIINNGTIAGSGSNGAAIDLSSDLSLLTNAGLLAADNYNVVYIHGNMAGSFTNTATGTINGTADDTVRIQGATNAFTNFGTIKNSSIFANDNAVQFGGTIIKFNNTGTIEANANSAVVFSGGITGTGTDGGYNSGRIIQQSASAAMPTVSIGGVGGQFTNGPGGFIGGSSGLVYTPTATSATVVNAGTIEATSAGGTAIGLTNNTDSLTLLTGSTTTGLVDGRGGTDALTLDGTTSGSFAAAQLLNFETITKQGSGSWSLSGDNGAAMTAAVTAGLLGINGNLAATNFTVTGGTLGGNGTVGTVTVNSGGHVAPGNSVGTLHTGSIVFADGSFYDVEVAGAAADKLEVTGTATVGNNVTLNVGGSTTSCGNLSVPILTASGGQTGTFTLSTLLSNVSLAYDANNTYLNITNGTGRVFTGFTNTANQASTAAALDAMGCANQPYSAQLAVLTDAQVPAAMDALSGEGHAGIAGALVEGSQSLPSLIDSRIEQAFAALDGHGAVSAYGDAPILLSDTGDVTLWGSAYGGLKAQSGNGNASGWQSSATALVVGADGKVNEDVRLGALGGIGFTGISARATQGTSTDLSVAAYGSDRLGATSIKAGLAYTRHLISTSRAIVFPGVNDVVTASYQAGTAQLFAEVAHDFDVHGTTLTPFARFDAMNHSTDGFTESGGQGQLKTAASVVNALFVTLGASGEDRFVLGDNLLVTARGSLGWRHAFGGGIAVVNSFTTGGPFTVAGPAIASDAAVLEASAVFDLTAATSLSVGFDGMIGSGLSASALKATLAGKF